MTSEVIAISPQDSVRQAAATMVRFKVNHLPVVENDVLVGMIARADVLWAMYRDKVAGAEGTSPQGR